MVPEVLAGLTKAPLNNQKKPLIIDATLGSGGHTKILAEGGAKVLGIEADPEMYNIAKERIGNTEVFLVNDNFVNIEKIAPRYGFNEVDGILFDLGISSLHYEDFQRGFSFNKPEEILDMRLDNRIQKVKACDLLNSLSKNQLKDLFSQGMQAYLAEKLAEKVVAVRKVHLFSKVKDFLKLFQGTWEKGNQIHPATKAFMALRIAVNSELDNIQEVLPKAFNLLKKGGRILVISFHSGEDVIIKNFFKVKEKEGLARLVTAKPIYASEEEIKKNPKARSAILRILEKI